MPEASPAVPAPEAQAHDQACYGWQDRAREDDRGGRILLKVLVLLSREVLDPADIHLVCFVSIALQSIDK